MKMFMQILSCMENVSMKFETIEILMEYTVCSFMNKSQS